MQGLCSSLLRLMSSEDNLRPRCQRTMEHWRHHISAASPSLQPKGVSHERCLQMILAPSIFRLDGGIAQGWMQSCSKGSSITSSQCMTRAVHSYGIGCGFTGGCGRAGGHPACLCCSGPGPQSNHGGYIYTAELSSPVRVFLDRRATSPQWHLCSEAQTPWHEPISMYSFLCVCLSVHMSSCTLCGPSKG